MKTLLAALLLLLAPALHAKTVSSVSILPLGAVIQNGTSVQFSATCTYTDNSVDDCTAAGGATWSSSWNSRMSVSASGVATAIQDPLSAVSPNNTNRFVNQFVVATVGAASAHAGVYTQHAGDTWYRYPTPDYRAITTYGTTNPTLDVAVGSRVSLGEGFVVNNPAGGTAGFPLQSLCAWTSSDPSKATIDTDARVTGLAPGLVTFTCNLGGNGNYGASTLGGWQAPGNSITLNIVAGGTGSATWYIRPDGGTPFISASRTPSGQCNGHSDAPYPGSGKNQNCALGNLSFLWADQVTANSLSWIISGGDTVIVAPNPARYVIGKTGVNCVGDPGYNCYMPTIPSGTAARHTKILGSNYASCHADSAKTGLTMDMQAPAAFNITDSQFVDVACFEITDAAACSTDGNFNNHCTVADHFGTNGILEDSLASANLTDLAIHGLAGEGIHGPSGPDVVADHIRISGMPFGGIDMDNGGWQSTNISSAGGFTLTNSVTEFIGCVEEYPIVHNYPYIECRDQNTGAYGDGFGTANTSGDWVFDHDIWRYNFQDGLDLLHSGMRSLSVTNSQSYANDGQQYKIGSGKTVVFSNNIALGNCNRILSLVGDEPASAIVPGVSGCRAAGDGIFISMSALGSDTFQNNTYVGYGSTSFDMACEAGFEICPDAKSTFQNNISIGLVDSTSSPGQQPGLFYTASASMPANNGWAVRDHNLYFNFRNGGCPGTLNAGELCSDAQFVGEPALTITNESVLDNFNFNLSASSPAKYAGTNLPALTLPSIPSLPTNLLAFDLTGTSRHNPPSIGALEFSTGSTTPAGPTSPTTPTAPTTPTTPTTPTKQSTSLTLSASPATAVVGQTVTLSAVAAPVGSTIPTGSLTFTINGATLTASLDATGTASVTVNTLPANTYTATATYAGDSVYAAATSNAASITITAAPAVKAISVAIGQPAMGFNVIPGSVRRIFGTVSNGTTNQLTWTVKSGGATLSATTGSWIDVKAPDNGSTCLVVGSSNGNAITSNSSFTVEATSMEDNSKKADVTLNVCKPVVQMSVVPTYRTLYADQPADLQSLLVGSTDESVTWTISSTPADGDGKLVDTTARDTVFSARAPGRYLVTATSTADSSKIATAVMYVTGHPLPYRVTRNHTEPIDCSVDPALRGQTYEVGPSQPYRRLQDVPLTSLPTGSTIRVHNEDASGTSPTVFNEYLQLEQSATPDQPIRLCGIPDAYGNLPILDGTNASTRSDTSPHVAGAGLITIGGTQRLTTWPSYSGAQSISVEGIHLRNARPDVTLIEPTGTPSTWSSSAACLLIGEGHDITVAGMELENCATGGASRWDGTSWNTSSLNQLWEGNYVHGNAAPGSVTNHQLYLQAWGQIVQFNRIDSIASGSTGTNLKSRGIQDVIRYNYFGDGATRELDLVDVTSAAPFMSFASYFRQNPGTYSMDQLAAWQEAWNAHFVYGNLYDNTVSAAPIHFAYDHDGGEQARKGNLYWYSNTFYQPQCTSCSGPMTLFDQSGRRGNYLPQIEFPAVYAFNNIVWTDPASFQFDWNDFSAFIGIGGNNLMHTNWGANTLQGGVGDGWNATPNRAAYQNASDLSLHVTGFSNDDISTLASAPFDKDSFLLANTQPNAALLPNAVCEMPTRFAYLPTLGYAIPRAAFMNVGATDTSVQTAALLNRGTRAPAAATRYSTCR